jgi:hypothetical protein
MEDTETRLEVDDDETISMARKELCAQQRMVLAATDAARGRVKSGESTATISQPLHSPLGAYRMHMTSKPGTELREVVPAERYFLEVCPSAGALLPPPGPCLRIG